MTLYHIEYGETTIEYELTFSERKTLGISVNPDLTVTVTAPNNSSIDTINEKVRKRASWILRQQREFELFLPHIPPRRYVSGETHRYLGKQYRLRVIQESTEEWVKLQRGYLLVRTRDKLDNKHVKELVDNWYMRQARRVFRERIQELLPRFSRFELPDFQLEIKELKSRWGSCTEAGTITLNLILMQVPKRYIDYVIVHELCHLLEHNHTKHFYSLLDRVLPDWRDRRHKLNAHDFS